MKAKQKKKGPKWKSLHGVSLPNFQSPPKGAGADSPECLSSTTPVSGGGAASCRATASGGRDHGGGGGP